MNQNHTTLEEWLDEEGIKDEATRIAIRRVVKYKRRMLIKTKLKNLGLNILGLIAVFVAIIAFNNIVDSFKTLFHN